MPRKRELKDPSPKAARRAAIYTRVSSADQVEGSSLGTQSSQCRAYVKAHGWNLVEEFVEEGVSGAKASRPSLDRMVRTVNAGSIDVVVVAKLDRLGRSVRHLSNLLGELDELGVGLVSVAEGFDSTSASGRLQRNILSSFAEFEREQIHERMWEGKLALARAGGWPGGPTPYGLKATGDRPPRRLELDPKESKVIRTVVDWLLTDGLSVAEAAERLNAKGVPTRKGYPWTRTGLRWILQDGTPLDGRWVYAPVSGTRRNPGAGLVVLEIPELIDSQKRAALERLWAASALGPRNFVRHYILTPMASPCGWHYRGQNMYGVSSYHCEGKRRVPCDCATIPAQAAEDAVWAEVVSLLSDRHALEALSERWLASRREHERVETKTLASVSRRISKLEKNLQSRVAEYLRSGLPADAVRSAVAEIEEELETLRTQRDRMAAYQALESGRTGRAQRIARLAASARKNLVDADQELRYRILQLLGVKVTVEGSDTCHACKGKGKLPGGRGGIRCETCVGKRRIARLSIEGEVPDALLRSGDLDSRHRGEVAWPFESRARAEQVGA